MCNLRELGTAGLEKDTDDPDGVYRTLDELKAMKPGPGVQWRDEMPVLSKENAGDLRRKKRSRKIKKKETITTLNRPYKSNINNGRKLFPLKGVDKYSENNPDMASIMLNDNLKKVYDHGIGVKKKKEIEGKWFYKPVGGRRKRHHRIVREAESNDRTSDSTDVPLSAESDQWWNKKLEYIDSRARASERNKLQQANNASADNLENMAEQRRTAVSLRGIISEERSPQSTSKQSLQGEISGEYGSDKKQTGTTINENKSDDWLKNELSLIEIESRALKRKAAQLHTKLRKANLNWKQGGSDNAATYAGDNPRPDIIETYSRMNRRIDNEGMEQRARGFQNIQTTEHKIERKHRLPGYGGRLRDDIADAVLKLDNDLSDLKSKMLGRSERPRDYYMKAATYRDTYSDGTDNRDYYSDRNTGRYRRSVAENNLQGWNQFHMFISSTGDSSSTHQAKSNHFQTHNCKYGSPCSRLGNKDHVMYTTERGQKHNTMATNIYRKSRNEIPIGHIESASNNRLPTIIKMSTFNLQGNTSLWHAQVIESDKGKHLTTIKSNIIRIIISLAKILLGISTLPRAASYKHPLLNTGGISWQDEYKIRGILGHSGNITAAINMSNRKSTNTQVDVLVLITQTDNYAPTDDNKVLTVLKTTSQGDFTLLHSWTKSRKLPTGRMSKDVLKHTGDYNGNGPPNASVKRRKSVDTQQIFLLSLTSKKHCTQTSLHVIIASAHTQGQLNLITAAKVNQENIAQLYLHLKLFQLLLKKQMKWSKLQVFPQRLRRHHERLTVYPCVFVIRGQLSAPDLQRTARFYFVQHDRSHTRSLRFFPFPNRGLHIRAPRRRRQERHHFNIRNRLGTMPSAASRVKENGRAKESLPIIFQTKRGLFRQAIRFSGGREKTYSSLQLFLDSRLFLPNFRNTGFMLTSVEHERFASLLQFTDTGLTKEIAFKNKIRNKRSSDVGNADSETENEISMKEDLDNLFKTFPVSDSEKLMNSKLEQAEEAEVRSADVGRYIMEKNKDADSIQDVLSSDVRFRRHVHAADEHEKRLDKKQHWTLDELLHRATKSGNGIDPGSVKIPEPNHERKKEERVTLSLPAVEYFENKSYKFIRDSLDTQNYSTSVQTIDDRGESIKPTDADIQTIDDRGESIKPTDADIQTIDDRGESMKPTDVDIQTIDDRGESIKPTDADIQTIDGRGESIKPTDTNKVPHNRIPYTVSKIASLLEASKMDIKSSRLSRETNDLKISENFSGPYFNTSVPTTLDGKSFPDPEMYTTDRKHYGGPLSINSSDSNDFNTNDTNLETDIFPGAEFDVQLHNGDSTTNGTRLPNLHNLDRHRQGREISNTEQSQLPSSLMKNSKYQNFINSNSALKAFIAANRNTAEFKDAYRTHMTNSSYRNVTEVADQQTNTSTKADTLQEFFGDYFDDNADLEEASETTDDVDVSDKTTGAQNDDEKEIAEETEISEGIEVDVKGHKVEPTEPFAFIEKDEVKTPTEYQYTWSEWGECSVTCGIGQKFRTNRCGGDQPCTGEKASSETEVCSLKEEC